MKKLLFSLMLLFHLIEICFSQEHSSITAITFPDSSELAFHIVPFVNTEIHGVDVRTLFDYKSSFESVNTIQNVLLSFHFINKVEVDSADIANNMRFAELFNDIETNNIAIIKNLSEISSLYSQRYIGFVIQYGFRSTPLLIDAKIQGNATSLVKASFIGFRVYEENVIALSQLLFIVFDKNSQSIVYNNLNSKEYSNDDCLFSIEETERQLVQLKRRLRRSIVKNLKHKGAAF